MRTITIPSSQDAALQRLNELESNISDLQWEKAALVSAYAGDNPSSFASKGLVGLTNVQDVQHYVQAGRQIGGSVKPGQSVTTPQQSFTSSTQGQSSKLSS